MRELLDINDLSLREAPWAYRELGWKVFPCWESEKAPATRHGFHNASRAPVRLRQWWPEKTYSAAQIDAMINQEIDPFADPSIRWGYWTNNIAIPTGLYFDVLDIDVKATDGFAAAKRLNDAGLLAGAFAVAETPSGGMHVLFPPSGQGCGALARHGLDFKARGGYVLVSPSEVATGHLPREERSRYVWTEVLDGDEPLDWDACKALLEPSRPRHRFSGRSSPAGLIAWLRCNVREGERNNALFWAARRLAEQGQDPSVLEEVALDLGLEPREAQQTISSAARAEGR